LSDENLRAAVERLAASPERQLAWLRELGTFPLLDELALEFDDEFDRMGSSVDHASSMRALTALDEQLSLMGGPENAGLWWPEALDGAEWSQVRELAVRALSELDGQLSGG
jgi:hypothetical protein